MLNSKIRLLVAGFAACLLAAGGICMAAAPTPTPKAKKIIAIENPDLKTEGKLKVASTAFKEGEAIPDKYAQAGQNVSPPIKWTGAPEKTKSFVLIAEDPDAPRAVPFVHWLVFNIPAGTEALPEGVPAKEKLEKPAGALQGKNGGRKVGYFGPRPPAGPAHHYHFQIFALDAPLDQKAGATIEELVEGMRGHVVAAGETVGTYQTK